MQTLCGPCPKDGVELAVVPTRPQLSLNATRFVAAGQLFLNNTVERCLNGVHVSYDISTSFLEGR